MPVNLAEQKLFALLTKRIASNTGKPLSQQTIADFRDNCKFLAEFTGEAANVPYQNSVVRARDGYEIPIRIYNPTASSNSPIMIFYPACAYLVDLFEANAIACSRIAAYSGVKVVAVNFRLAPENPLPVPVYDAYDVTKYIFSHPEQYGIDPKNIFIGGLSSGAHAAAIISAIAAKNGEINIRHQILMNGLYDLTQSNLKNLWIIGRIFNKMRNSTVF